MSQKETNQIEEAKLLGKDLLDLKNEQFRIKMQQLVDNNFPRLQACIEELDGKEFIDAMFRIMPYAYSKPSEIKNLTLKQTNNNFTKSEIRKKLEQ